MALILLVEDNELNRDMLSRRLMRVGHEVIIAVDGAEGVRRALEDAPEIILMDLSLPILDGWEAVRRIRAGETERKLPIIALTAHAMVGEDRKAFEAGCDDFDTKPVEFTRLKEKIDRLLGGAPGPA